MRKLFFISILCFLASSAYGQYGAIQEHCYLGGTVSATSGLKSANFLNGIIPGCTVTVYLTGTTTKATIYSSSTGGTLTNPFTANIVPSTDPGGWIFWADPSIGLDVVMSGGNSNALCTTAPLCYTRPVTLTDVFAPANPCFIGGCAFPISAPAFQASGLPVIDLRNPIFAGGAVCDNATDIGPAVQAAVTSLGTRGAIIDIVGATNYCYWANPTTLTWSTGSGPSSVVEFRVSGKGLRLGSTFTFYDNINLVGYAGSPAGQFQASGPTGLVLGPSSSGLIGTTISGTGSKTFTPSSMTGLYPGTAISVDETITCTPTSINRNGTGLVTAVTPSACHIPPEAQVTVAGGGCTSGFTGNFLVNSLDYPTNTITWLQSGGSGSATSCTITGYNEDRHETTSITSTTSTTATANFVIPHSASANFGIVGLVISGLNHHFIDSILLQGSSGVQIWFGNTFFTVIKSTYIAGSGLITSGSMEDSGGSEVWITDQSIIQGNGLPALGSPWAIHATRYDNSGGCGMGGFYVKDSYILVGIKYDSAYVCFNPGNVSFDNVIFERVARAAFTYNPVGLVDGSTVDPPAQIIFDKSQEQDNVDSYIGQKPLVYSTTPSAIASNGSHVFIGKYYLGAFNSIINTYAQLPVHFNGFPGIQLPVGRSFPLGTYDTGSLFKGEHEGEGASLGPSTIPYTTLATSAISCSSPFNSCVTGIRDPGGTTTATEIDCGTNCGVPVVISTQSIATYPGDWFIYGSWVRPGSGQTSPDSAVGQADPFQLGSLGGDTFAGGGAPGAFAPGFLSGDGWHAQVAYDTIVTGNSTAHNVQFKLYPGTGNTFGNQFYYPFWIFVPGPNNPSWDGKTTIIDIEQVREQMLHGLVLSGYNNPGVPTTPLPISAGGYQIAGAAALNHCLLGNGISYVDSTSCALSSQLPLTGTTGSIGGGALTAGTCASGTATVTGATTSMEASASPGTYPGDAFTWKAYVSASNTVTVKVCTNLAAGGTPTASTYIVRVIQ